MVTYYNNVSAQVAAMGMEERMTSILQHVLQYHRITNSEVQQLLRVSKPTATRILQKLGNILELVGTKGQSAYYRIRTS